jgi:two-component system, NarL family, sensor histidine kinase DesK
MAGDDGMAACGAAAGRPGLTLSGATGKWEWGPGSGSPWRWFFSGIWLVYLIQPIADLSSRHHTAAWTAGGIALTLAFCTVYLLVTVTWDRRPREAQLGLGVIAVLAVLACLVYGSDWNTLWIYVSVATGFVVPGRRRAMLAVAGVGGCYLLLSSITHAAVSNALIVLLPVVLVGWAMVGFRMQILLMQELRQARETVARLAANEERLRLARDMHDLTGQSLSLITLKSELAARRLAGLAPSAERDAALAEITDIGRVSRQTLHDIREAVSGYRRPTLAVEIITARTLLEAAGIHLDDDPALTTNSGSFGPDAEAALAWCLREAATNVIRHSGARNCRIRLTGHAGELSLEVSDDGRGLSRAGGAPGDEPLPAGSGLHGMSERLSAAGGRFSAGSVGRDGRGFRLIATVPASPVTPAAATLAPAATPALAATSTPVAGPAPAAAHGAADRGRGRTVTPGAADANVPS